MMNCEECKTGIQETYWFVDLSQGELKPSPIAPYEMDFYQDKVGYFISICSRDDCRSVKFRATRNALTHAKWEVREFRESV